jgi:hypothetical protein
MEVLKNECTNAANSENFTRISLYVSEGRENSAETELGE